MTPSTNDPSTPRTRRGPKPRGRTVIPLTITVTLAQRAALEARADERRLTISALVRQFIAAGLAAGMLSVLAALIRVSAMQRVRAADAPPAWTRTIGVVPLLPITTVENPGKVARWWARAARSLHRTRAFRIGPVHLTVDLHAPVSAPTSPEP